MYRMSRRKRTPGFEKRVTLMKRMEETEGKVRGGLLSTCIWPVFVSFYATWSGSFLLKDLVRTASKDVWSNYCICQLRDRNQVFELFSVADINYHLWGRKTTPPFCGSAIQVKGLSSITMPGLWTTSNSLTPPGICCLSFENFLSRDSLKPVACLSCMGYKSSFYNCKLTFYIRDL